MAHGQDKTALITGGSRGIGAEIAKRLAADGFTVAVNYASNPGSADAVVKEIVAAGGKAFAVAADVSDAKAVATMFESIAEQASEVAVLVNNAGVMELAPIAKMDAGTFDRMVAINLKGTFNTLQEAARRMGDGGRIINTSSSVTKLRQPAYGPYAATKAAVETLTAILARELRGRNITVNAVAPGPTATELFFKGKSDELIANIKKMAPLERLGEPSDIASVVSFLAGPDGAWINGQTLFANGGAI
ncbi:3-oxoacyl-[acyl-carrier protein] reductase [Faunimonas pinastri]|uniref:3-oxoacyl-[acyl-carrier protein] reductase n=1 Tax=Faunimonas pinastri TaxID=1855383 RepID=A0A1H9Q4D7_9HYPH|nr:SDR family oxidoreductase [Faunimonas pinastri]SER55300.1 3-oxoacyl-[acyl-carrier protein] reductase [Faunimonas pinastri]